MDKIKLELEKIEQEIKKCQKGTIRYCKLFLRQQQLLNILEGVI